MSVGESLGSHSLHSFAEFLQRHIHSPGACSCLTSRPKHLPVLTPFSLKPFRLKPMATDKSVRKGGRQRRGNTSKDLPPDLSEMYKTDPEEDYNQRKTQIQWIRRYWAEQWFKYRFVTQEYAEKNAIKHPWGDITYKNLPPKTRAEAIAQGFYPCMVRGPQPADADPSTLLWCRDDNLFKRNLQYAKNSAKENKKNWGLDFNPGPSAPRADGTREAEPNLVGPFYNLEGLISHIRVQGADVDRPADEADSEEAPATPKPKKKKKSKASKTSTPPKASRVKPLATAPPAPSVQSEEHSRISKSKQLRKKPMHNPSPALTPDAVLKNANEAIDLSSDEDLGDDALEQLIKSKQDA